MVPVAAKVGALLAVAAAGSTSIWYFSDSIFGPSVISVSADKESNYAEGSVGKKYGDYFLSSKKNQKIWEERYEKNKNKFKGQNNNDNKAKDKFGTVEKAYSNETNNTTALNKACEAAYQLAESTNLVDTEPSSDQTIQFFNPYVWKFCGLGSITTVNESDYGGNIGGDATNKKLFVSTKVDSNDWFWDLKSKDFWSTDKSKLAGNGQAENVFKKLREKEEEKGTSIKTTCEDAYGKGSSNDSNKNKDDALTFCSMKLTVGTASNG